MSIIDNLVEIQELDRKIEEVKSAFSILKNGPPAKREYEEKVKAKDEAKKILQKKQSELRVKNLDLDDNLAKQKSLNDKITAGKIKNPKELSIAEKEIKSFKAQQNKIEDEILSLEEEIEKIQQNIKEIESYLIKNKPIVEEEEKKYENKIHQLSKELMEYETRRNDCLSKIDESILAKYYELCKTHGAAIAMIENGTCSECYISLSTSIIDKVKRGEELVLCENCSRILCIEKR